LEAAPSEVEALRQEIAELRGLVRSLQEQVRALALRADGGAPSALPEIEAPSPAPLPPQTAAAAPRARSASLMNPAISAVFQGIGATSLERRRDENGWDLSEAEVAFQSAVDPYARVDLYLAFPDAETPEVEEGFITTLALPASLQIKGGRFKSAFGKWNTLHTHAFFTVDRPDALSLYFGDESFTSDGLSLNVLVPNPWDLYIESVSEIGTAREGSAFNSESRSLTWLQHIKSFFSLGHSNTLEVGLSASRGFTGPSGELLEAIADPNAPAGLEADSRLPSAVQGLDVTWKWRPPQSNLYRSFLWQTEILRSRREIEVLTPAFALRHDAVTSLGGYSYIETQFTRRWRYGLRGDVANLAETERARMWAASAVVRFVPSEFQEIRFQVRRSRFDESAAALTGEERSDTRLLFEWIPVIGAHGAHKY
jgi:hypothetical protein